uniref:PUM-HD domain-containing protein n=1 Tax=Elaeophora elaphi TaxID=1147741 RepID=A0A0R3RWW5_9BILA
LFSSSSSGEIRDDSDGEAGDAAHAVQPEATKNGFIEHHKRELERDFYVGRESDIPQGFDPDNDYRQPHLSPEQICLRVRKIPAPDVLVELSDVGLRNLLCDVHELDREQIRLSNNRRKLLEQMRQMHKQEIGSLRECMETLKKLMSERGMNLLATHIGQDVMEFLHEKDQTFNAGSVPLSTKMQALSSESCHGSYGVFPKTQSFAQNSLPPRPHFVPERSGAFSYPPVASTIPTPFVLPPPDFSVPPPFPAHTLQGNDQVFDGPGTSAVSTRDVSVTSSMSAPSLCGPVVESGAPNPLRSISLVSTNDRGVEIASGSNNHIPPNGTVAPEKGRLGFRPKANRELDHPGMLSGVPQQPPQPPVMGLMRTQQRFGMPPCRDGAPILDSRGVPFIDERGSPFPNSRVVSLYDDGRLPFHEYEHPQGDEAIRIRHVWSTRPSITQRRMLQPGVFRDRKIQRAAVGMSAGRIYGTEMRDRSRSPRNGSKPIVANSSCETGTTTTSVTPNVNETHALLNNDVEENVILVDENSEPGTNKISQC